MAGAIAIWRNYQAKAVNAIVPLFITTNTQKRSICVKEHLRLDEEIYPKPWPYKEKGSSFVVEFTATLKYSFHALCAFINIQCGNISPVYQLSCSLLRSWSVEPNTQFLCRKKREVYEKKFLNSQCNSYFGILFSFNHTP